MKACYVAIAICLMSVVGCGEGELSKNTQNPKALELKSLSVSVMGVMSPEAVKFAGYCAYDQVGKQRKKDLAGEGNINKAFRGEKITYCEVRKTSEGGWISLIISEDGKTLFESEQRKSNDAIIYKPE